MVPDLRSPRNLAYPLRKDPVWTILRVKHGLTQLAPILLLLVSCLVFETKRAWQSKSKHLKRWYRAALTMRKSLVRALIFNTLVQALTLIDWFWKLDWLNHCTTIRAQIVPGLNTDWFGVSFCQNEETVVEQTWAFLHSGPPAKGRYFFDLPEVKVN